MISEYKDFLEKAIIILQQEEQIVGVAAAGSYISDEMDEFSDLDLVIAIEPEYYNEIMAKRLEIADKLGNLLSAFTGEHVGEPRVLICLYNNPILHVDLKFVSFNEISHRVEDFKVLWERNKRISKIFETESSKFPNPDLQWIEDRFWIWVHYGAG